MKQEFNQLKTLAIGTHLTRNRQIMIMGGYDSNTSTCLASCGGNTISCTTPEGGSCRADYFNFDGVESYYVKCMDSSGGTARD